MSTPTESNSRAIRPGPAGVLTFWLDSAAASRATFCVLKVYHYPKCSTCKNALKWLEGRGLAFTTEDIKAKPPTVAELKAMLQAYDGELRRLFNTSGMDYRALGLKDQLPSMSEKEAFALLRSNGMLVKRPFVLGEGTGVVGFREKEWSDKLG